MALTEAQIEQFRRDGYVSGIPALSGDEAAQFRANTERFERDHAADVPWAFDIKCNLLFDWVYENAAHPRILEPVAQLIGKDVLMTNSVFRIKDPGSSVEYGWHQDSVRIVVLPCPVIVYVAFSEASEENGCLSVIPGTHREIAPFDLISTPWQPKRRVARVRNPDTKRAVNLLLKPGELALFSANVIHGSGPNRSRGRRVAILHDYTPADARQSVGRSSGQLVMGEDRWDGIAHEPVPGPDFETNAALRRRILGSYPENILMGPLDPGEKADFSDRPADRAA